MTSSAPSRLSSAQAARAALTSIAPGLIVAVTVAAAAKEIGAVTAFPPVALALLIGMLFAGLVSVDQVTPGVVVATRPILRIGVALLGVQVTLQDLAGLGYVTIAITLAGLVTALAAGLIVARLVGLPRGVALVASSAVAICGASAALAVAAVVPDRERQEEQTAAVIAAVTIIGSLAMLGYPTLTHSLSFPDDTTAIFLGATLHEVAQAVGAGMAVSDHAGSIATAVKLLRVACLSPVVIFAALVLRRGTAVPTASRPPLVPVFLLMFFGLAAASSAGAIPPEARPLVSEVSRSCMLVAIAALGMKISLRKMLSAGRGLLLVIVASTAALAGVVALLLNNAG